MAARQLPPNPERQALFNLLKPSCVALSSQILTSGPVNPRALTAALTALHQTLTTLPSGGADLDNKIGDYIFFPLSHVFRAYRTLPDRALELALLCLLVLIQTCWRLQVAPELGRQLVILLTFVVGGAPGEANERSEETKTAGVRCLRGLFEAVVRGTGNGGLVENLPALGHTVTTLLEGAAGAESATLQEECVGSLEVLLVEVLKDEPDIRAGFFPGVVSGLVRAVGLGATTKRPYTTLVGIVGLVGNLVGSVLADEKVAKLPETDDADEEVGGEEIKVHRTKAWVKMTAGHTKVALEQLLKLRTHPKLDVRQAVFALCRDILETCAKTLADAEMALVESMIVLSGDTDETLARLAENTVRVMASMNAGFKESVRSCLDRWITVLPRIMTSNDEDAKERVIVRLSLTFGLCTELGLETDLLRDMLAASIKESLIAALAPTKSKGISIQSSSVSSIQPRLAALVLQEGGHHKHGQIQPFPDVIMGQRSQYGTMESMKQLLGHLGQSSENALSLAQRNVRDASVRGGPAKERATSLWIAINLLKGSLKESSEMDMFFDLGMVESNPLQQRVTEELFYLSLSYLTNTAEFEDGDTDGKDGAMIQCLALESLSLVAQTQKRAFREELVEALYPVVHHLGAASPEVQSHAMVTLNNIATACEYADAKELLLENVDYMVNAVSLKLNIFDLSPQAPVVLGMMLKLVGPSLVPFLDDLVVDIVAILDGFHDYEKLCSALFEVLGTIVEESAKSAPEVLMIGAEGTDTFNAPRHRPQQVLDDAELLKHLREARELKKNPRTEPSIWDDDKESTPHKPWGKPKDLPGGPNPTDDDPEKLFEELSNGDGDGDTDQLPPPADPEPPKLTPTYTILRNITSLTQHYLPHDSYPLRLRVLRLVTTAATALGGHENEFLPLLNEVWPMVVERLSDAERSVAVEACAAVTALAVAAGDFVGTRVVDLWPLVRRVWLGVDRVRGRGSAGKSTVTGTAVAARSAWGGMGVYAPEYKLWDALLTMLTRILGAVRLPAGVLGEMCETFGDILELRVELREALEKVAADEVWCEIQARRGGWAGGMPEVPEWEARRGRSAGEVWGAVVF
ncbi:armadillo-type protein [Geopyxis carbonaria]|nr:armadillo-type protein [Geopyxis carbonaria]